MELEKDQKEKNQMALPIRKPQHDEFFGQHLIDYLIETLAFERLPQLASLLDVNERTLRYWAKIPYNELDKSSLRLRALFLVVERMNKDNIPASAILKLISGQLIKRENAPTLISVLNGDPANPLIDVTVENLVQAFKKSHYTQVSSARLDELNERFQLTDEQRAELLKKLKK